MPGNANGVIFLFVHLELLAFQGMLMQSFFCLFVCFELLVCQGKQNSRWHCPVCEIKFRFLEDQKMHMATAHGHAKGVPINFAVSTLMQPSHFSLQDYLYINKASIQTFQALIAKNHRYL